MGKISLIAQREFNERVRKKSFIITTILVPVLMVGLMALMVWIMNMDSTKGRIIEVVDNSGLIAEQLGSEGSMKFRVSTMTPEEILDNRPDDLFGLLVIGEDILVNEKNIQFYTFEASTMALESSLASQINHIIETERLKDYNIDNLQEILTSVKANVTLHTMEVSDTGETKDSSSTLSYIISLAFGMVVYMVILMYGNMVMLGVIEEKTNKVLEVIVSSVRPFQLMMGKILGIASVAITQLVIWVVFIGVVGMAVMKLLAGDMVAAAEAMQAGGATGMPAGMENIDLESVAIISRLTDVSYVSTMLLSFILFFIGGYMLYAAMYAAVGSAVDNEKDSQNLQFPITLPLILGFFIAFSVGNDPNSTLAFWGSIIPFTSPIVMMARVPYGVPMWELGLSIALLYATFVGFVLLAGKIYRVGIFMYGKKPSFKELAKWVRYKY